MTSKSRTMCAVAAALVFASVAAAQAPLGTAFTYQGRLTDGGKPANGNFDLEFRLFDAAVGGAQVGDPVLLPSVPVAAGLFTAQLNANGEFGPTAFDGQARWLEISVNGTPLSPRQELTAAPNALFALNADLLDGLDSTDFLQCVDPRIAINATNTPGDADSLFKIREPGSYYLTGNITGVVGKHGIEIAANGVTLDLNGFDLRGVAGSLDGVSVTVAGLRNIAVVNGSIRSWGDEGVDLVTVTATNCRVAELLASGNGGNGISVGTGCTVSNCSAYQNTSNGIFANIGCTVSNCSAYQNTGNGIATSFGSTVSNCSAYNNTGTGIISGTGGTVSNCSAYNNTGIGINTGNGCTVSNCSANENSSNGIATSIGCTVSNCSAFRNLANGIATNSGSTVSNCSAYQNTGTGISTGLGSTVSNCTASANGGDGISASDGSTVADCTAQFNNLDGIRCSVSCVIRSNTCSTNGFGGGVGAGIRATSTDNRLEGNTCTGADRGIEVEFSGNIIIRNICSGNDIDWIIAANNVYGPIIDRRAPASPAVAGFSAPGSLGSTDANANFSY